MQRIEVVSVSKLPSCIDDKYGGHLNSTPFQPLPPPHRAPPSAVPGPCRAVLLLLRRVPQ